MVSSNFSEGKRRPISIFPIISRRTAPLRELHLGDTPVFSEFFKIGDEYPL
jgi:hypothetical protein